MFKQRPTLMEDISKVVAVRKNVNTAVIDSLSTTVNEDSINGFAQNLLGKIKTFFH